VTAPHPPSIDALSRLLPPVLPAALRVSIARAAVERSRRDSDVDPVAETRRLAAHLNASRQRPVINATGVILHTNLGRAPVDQAIAQRAAEAASSYTNLELDLEDGSRGGRTSYVSSLLCALTGAETPSS
jgi:L-seryl-tRNA(Ser) seleniumtransferase